MSSTPNRQPTAAAQLPELARCGKVLRARDAGALLRYSANGMARLANDEQLPAFRVGREWRFPREGIAKAMAAGVPAGGAPYPGDCPELAEYPDIMIVREVADELMCAEVTVRNLAADGKLAAFRLGDSGEWRFLRRAVCHYMRRDHSPSPAA